MKTVIATIFGIGFAFMVAFWVRDHVVAPAFAAAIAPFEVAAAR